MKLCHLHGRASKGCVSGPAPLTAVLCRRSVQVAWSVGEGCPAHPCPCVLAGECRGRASHPPGCVPAPLALCALCSWQEVRRTRWQVTPVCSPVLCRGLCPGACCHDGGEEACTTCALFPVGPSACWGQPLSKVTTKWQQLWHLLAPPGAQVKGMVASQRRGLEHPPVC